MIGAVLIALSAFFVAIEFALVAARRYRLEEAAGTSASARAALRSSRDLSLLLPLLPSLAEAGLRERGQLAN